jgi:ABC-type Na+ efflux pump permease subunit
MSSDHETDSSIENIKSWEVESSSSVEEFDDYSKALDLFNIKSDQDEEPILYEIQKSKINGSILKRIPILNIKQSKKRKEELEKKAATPPPKLQQQKQATSTNKNKPQDIKFRIVILVIIIVAFLILLYVLSQLVISSDTLNAHFSLGTIKKSSDFCLIA